MVKMGATQYSPTRKGLSHSHCRLLTVFEHDLCSVLTNLHDIKRKVIRVVVVNDVSEFIGPKVGEA